MHTHTQTRNRVRQSHTPTHTNATAKNARDSHIPLHTSPHTHAHANTAHPLNSLDSVTRYFFVLRPAQYRDIFTPCHQLRASSTCFVDVNHTSTNTSPDQPISYANF
mmetsp:Transcript_80858/g.131050  ORF Transcript_80858/g.131050 Transcript_80858/m.131050 type:complete len:107 (-) Transcript_80858:69-389(-)